jgi:phage terminase large subunit-like protein
MAKLDKKLATEVAAKTDVRHKCRTDKFFLAEVLGYDFQLDVHTDLFANYISYDESKPWTEQSTIKNRLILWSRGFYKTTSAVVEIIQAVLNFPDIRILLMQGSVPNTKTLLKEIKSHFDGTNFRSRLKEIFPEFCETEKRFGTAMDFTVPCRTRTLKDPTVRVASPRTVKAGQHYDAGFFDDLINEQNFRNPRLIQKAIGDFNLYTPLIDPGGYKFVTGTRYAFGDLYEWVIRQDSVTHEWNITLRPCWHKDEQGNLVSNFPPRKLADGRIVGISVEQLLAIQREDAEMFAAQYLNQPISVSKHPFPEELILKHVRSMNEEKPPALGPATLFIDLAASKKDDRDHTVVLTGQQDSMGIPFVTDCVGGSWGPFESAKVIIGQALKHRPLGIYLEETAAGMVFKALLETVALDMGVRLPLNLIKVNNNKDAKHFRIMVVSGLLKKDRLYFLAGLPAWDAMLQQFTAYPQMRHDDYPDTVALMCEHYQTNTYRPPVVKSIGQYLVQHAAIPEILKAPEPVGDMGGSMGSFFE